MPPANAHSAESNQDPDRDHDRQDAVAAKFAKVLAQLNSSFEGVRDGARAAASRMIATHGEDIAAGVTSALRRAEEADKAVRRGENADQAAVAIQAAAFLQQENTELRAEIERLRSAHGDNGGAPAVAWSTVGTSPQKQAKWCLNENLAGRFYLNDFEKLFLPSIAERTTALNEQEQAIFDKIVAAVTRRTGKAPP